MVHTYAIIFHSIFLFRLLGDGFRQIMSDDPEPVQDTITGIFRKREVSGLHSALSESSEANFAAVCSKTCCSSDSAS